MQIRPLAADEVESFVEELWVPFTRASAEAEPFHPLADDLRGPGIEHRRDRLADDAKADVVAAVDGDLVGFASAERESMPPIFDRGPDCHVSELYVAPDYRRDGIGAALLDACRERGAAWNCATLSISVSVENEAARRLYEREGFTPNRTRLVQTIDGESPS